MSAPTPLPLRRAVWQRRQRGQSPAQIAAALGLKPHTVRQLLRQFRDRGTDTLAPAYAAGHRPATPTRKALHDRALELRRQHPTWGAGLLRIFLQREHPRAAVPGERTLQRWLHAAGLSPAPVGRRPDADRRRATQPHDVWQVDAAERIRLQSGQRVSWLRVVDECSGAVLQTTVFPQGNWLQVAVTAVQDELRTIFARWGLPAAFRVDNGGPWGSAGDLPPDLALWLLGVGVDVFWNDPHAPEQNGVVERSQGTGKRWAEPGQCATPEELQQRLQEMDAIQRETYPSIEGQSRAAAFPGLAHSGRPYRRSWERKHWDHERVLRHLAEYAVPRRVDKNGDVSLYHRPHYVGSMHRGKVVYVMVDPQRVEWVFADARGQQLRAQPAVELHAARIQSLTVTNRR